MKLCWGPAWSQRHRIVDPATGRPARTPVQGVTVVADECWYAEALAKATFLAGPDDGVDLLNDAGASGYFFCDNDRTVAAGDWNALLATT
jgi:thiamine biosynthesis lipoprotein ApbE